MSATNASTPLRCTCGSRDLHLTETIEATTMYEVIGGRLDRDDGVHEPDGYIRLEAKCLLCRRRWRPRRIDGRRSGAIQITCVTIDDDAVARSNPEGPA